MQRLMNAQAAFVATHVGRLTRLAKSARQVIDEPEIDVRVVAASATSRRCSTLQRPLSGRPVNRGKDRFWPVSDLRAPTGQRPRLHVRLLCHFESVINLDAEVANRTFQSIACRQ
jgi:hypothetical protein